MVIEAMNAGEFERVPDFVDQDELQAWYAGFVRTQDAPAHEWTAAELMQQDPDMPLEAAEYYAARLRRQVRKSAGSLHGQFAGLETRAELARTSVADALARYLRAQDPAWQFEQRSRAMGVELSGRTPPVVPVKQREVVGVVSEGEDRAFVVYRVRWLMEGQADVEYEVEVASLRRTTDGWRLQLRGELFELGPTVVVGDGLPDDASADHSQRTDGA